MKRRDFLQSFGALTAAAAFPGALAAASSTLTNSRINWAAGWQSVKQTRFDSLEMTIQGKVPTGLNGALYRNGPALSERAGIVGHHWFDGDGMIQRYAIANGGITHSGNMVQTERFLKEEEAQRFLYQQAGTAHDDALPVRNNDTSNQANIAVMEWNDELLALWEGGSAYRVNPNTLETIGRKDWRDDLKHMPFSAHPLNDQKGRVWNFGFAPYAGQSGMLIVYGLSQAHGMEKVQPINLPFAGYIHDFAQTERHLIFLIPPYHYKHEHGDTYVSKFKWEPNLGSRLLVVEKDDLSKQHWFDAPAGFVFHFGNAWHNNYQIAVNMCWYADPSLMQSSRQQIIDAGHRPLNQQAKVCTLFADLNTGKTNQVESETVMEFPNFDETSFSKDDELVGVGVIEKNGHRNEALTVYNPYSGKASHYSYPENVIAEEPLQITSAADKQPYIVQTYLDMQKQHTGLNIFRRDAISEGPIASAGMARRIPLGFHGTFIKS